MCTCDTHGETKQMVSISKMSNGLTELVCLRSSYHEELLLSPPNATKLTKFCHFRKINKRKIAKRNRNLKFLGIQNFVALILCRNRSQQMAPAIQTCGKRRTNARFWPRGTRILPNFQNLRPSKKLGCVYQTQNLIVLSPIAWLAPQLSQGAMITKHIIAVI